MITPNSWVEIDRAALCSNVHVCRQIIGPRCRLLALVKGNAYGHVAIEVDDAYQACEQVKQAGGKVVREAGPMMHGTTVIAFVEDPDGYKIEFIQKGTQ